MEYHTPGVYIREVDSGARADRVRRDLRSRLPGLFKHNAAGRRDRDPGDATAQRSCAARSFRSSSTRRAPSTARQHRGGGDRAHRGLQAPAHEGQGPQGAARAVAATSRSIGKSAAPGKTKITVGKESVEVERQASSTSRARSSPTTESMVEEMLNAAPRRVPARQADAEDREGPARPSTATSSRARRAPRS